MKEVYYQQQKATEEQLNWSRFSRTRTIRYLEFKHREDIKNTLDLIKPIPATTWLFSHLLSANSSPLGQPAG